MLLYLDFERKVKINTSKPLIRGVGYVTGGFA